MIAEIAKTASLQKDKPLTSMQKARNRFESMFHEMMGAVSLGSVMDRLSNGQRIIIVDNDGHQIFRGYKDNCGEVMKEPDRYVCRIGLEIEKVFVDEHGYAIRDMWWHRQHSDFEPVAQTDIYMKITVE